MRLVIFIGVALLAGGDCVGAQTRAWRPPAEQERCPSKWGPTDQRGAANHVRPDTVLRSVRLIRTGDIFQIGHVLSRSMPLSGTRRFEMYTKRTVMNAGANRRGSNEEVVFAELGQVGTQLDGLSHQTIGDSLYNCFKLDEIATRTGFVKLGIEDTGPLITRGVLIDVAALKGLEVLPDRSEITAEDLQAALRRQQLALQPGDAAIINTGWGRLWDTDPVKYARSSPGIGIAAAEWLARQDPMLVGSDNSSVNLFPDPDPDLSEPVHQLLLVVHGIYLLENLALGELSAKQIYEFALFVQPLRIQGATGSTVAPIAVR